MKLGRLKLDNNLFLAPLDGVNSPSFRMLCKKCGAGLVSTPMIDTESFLRNNDLFYWYKDERPLLVQFIGNDPAKFKSCLKELTNCDIVDLNAGCPSVDQNQRGCGAALLKNLPLMKKIIEAMVKYSSVPVSVKCRMGYDNDDSLKIAKVVSDAGASMICMHPRTKFEGYGTPAKYSVIKKLKENINMPVIASGDLLSPKNVKSCFDTTGCDGVMIARGAINDPFIFKDSAKYLKTGKVVKHSVKDRVNLIKKFIRFYHKFDKAYNLSELRNHSTWLAKEIPNAAHIRDLIGRSKNEEEIIKIINSIEIENV
ncbi:tRNA-dihydrouridine synthase B [Candidatus Tiddalikarchaeum anstoanum]|nr:tRNA-dihydrouridine synthase B [Candidatus Tiddalikarchaeum anstoanum]